MQNRYTYMEPNHGSGHIHAHRHVRHQQFEEEDITDQEDLELSEMNESTALASSGQQQQQQPQNLGDHPVLINNNNNINHVTDNHAFMPPALKRPSGLGFDLVSPHNELMFSRDASVDYLPSKSEILLYFTQAQKFNIKRLNNDDMQITDAEGFPLFDAWLDVNLCYRFWRIEAYGKTVLSMREPLSLSNNFTRPRVILTDWNGDFFGALSPGDPFILLSAERQLVAKIVSHRSPTTETEMMGLEPSPQPPPQSSASKQCWLCVLEGTGRHIARLEDYQIIQFNKDVAFQLKLLTLAAIVRLVGQISPANNFAYVVKYMLNCCAGGT